MDDPALGAPAPDFELDTQFRTRFRLSALKGRRAALLLFYPADWTPTCSSEIPAVEALAPRLLAEAGTQPVALSVDSRHSHAAWAADVGGVSYPLLADCWPRGAVARAYGALVEDGGVADRTVALVDVDGVLRHLEHVPVDGVRDAHDLLALARAHAGPSPVAGDAPPREALVGVLYSTPGCANCRYVERTMRSLRVGPEILVRDVDADPGARLALLAAASRGDAAGVPTLVLRGREVLAGPDAIVARLVAAYGAEGVAG